MFLLWGLQLLRDLLVCDLQLLDLYVLLSYTLRKAVHQLLQLDYLVLELALAALVLRPVVAILLYQLAHLHLQTIDRFVFLFN